MEPGVVIQATYYAAAGTLLLALAGFLAFTPGGGVARRLLALSLALSTVSTYASAYSLAAPTWTGALGATADLGLLASISLLGFYILYPQPTRWRSAGTALQLGALAFLAVALIAWLGWRSWFLDVPDMRRTLQWHWLGPFGEMVGLVALGAIAISILRASRVAPDERRGAAVLLSGLALPIWFAPGAIFSAWVATAIAGGTYAPSGLAALSGDPLRLTAMLWIVNWILAPLALAALVATTLRTRLPLIFLGVGIALGLIGAVTPLDITWVGAIVTVAIIPYALVRHGALGGRAAPAWASSLLATAAGAGAFLLVNAFLLSIDAANPLLLVVGIMLGALAAAGAVAFTLPRARSLATLATASADTTRERLGPYRALLQQEIAAGTPRDELASKLRAARASLGVSDHEHAVLEYGMLEGTKLARRDVAPGLRFLDRYRVLKQLREGGAGVTHLCHDERLGRDVVIKALRGADAGPESLAAVVAEARAMGRIRDPHVVTVLDVEQIGHEAFIVMEHVEGGSLADRLTRGPLARAEFVRVADDLLRALEAVHAVGLVHRDVKPSNVLLTAAGEAKLADFGIAHLPGFETTAAQNPGSGSVAGTIPYMSPEQARGRSVGVRGDLFSAAATLYEAWTGERYLAAERGESAVELQLRAASAGPFDRAWDGPAPMRAFWERALHPVASERFGSAREMREALDKTLLGGG